MALQFFTTENNFQQEYAKNPQKFDVITGKVHDNIIIGNSIKKNGQWFHPFIPGYETIVVLMKSTSRWGFIGPYELKTKDGYIFENYWQFSKVYHSTPVVDIKQYARPIWKYPATTFIDQDGNITEDYWKWRYKGYNHPVPVRYPVGIKNMKNCIYAVPEFDKTKKLNYIESRKEIYIKKYIESLQGNLLFDELKNKFVTGTKLIITEVDGFHSKNAKFYKEKYPELVNEPLEYGLINATNRNMYLKIHEPVDPCGHAYPLALALKGLKLDELV